MHFRNGRTLSWAVVSGLVLLMVSHTLNQQWSSPDYFLHQAAVAEYRVDLWNPGNPLVTGDAPDPYMSPYTWFVAAFAVVTGVDSLTALQFGAILNLLLLLAGGWYLVRTLTAARWAPLLALVFTLVAWGIQPWRWSGFYSFNSIGFVLPYSSAFATATGLVLIASAIRFTRDHQRRHLLYGAALAPLLVLVHPFTAGWVFAVVLAVLVQAWARLSWADWVWILAALVVGAVLALSWPHFGVEELLGGAGDFDGRNQALLTSVATRTFLALPGLVIVIAWSRSRQYPLTLATFVLIGVLIAALLAGSGLLARALPGLLLLLHVAMAVWLAEWVENPSPRRLRLAAAGLSVLLLVGIAGSAAGLARALPAGLVPDQLAADDRLNSVTERYRDIGGNMAETDVFVAEQFDRLGIAAFGGRSVGAPRPPMPFLDDRDEREIDDELLRNPQAIDRGEWTDLANQYGLDWLVVERLEAAAAAERFRRSGISVIEVVHAGSFSLLRVGAG